MEWLDVLKEYGVWGFLLAGLFWVIQKGEITFRYPRRKED